MGRRRKGRIGMEDRTEDVCFFCKDGGSLRLCDFKNCTKGFHPYCVKRDNSLLESEEDWFCSWHFCDNCHKSAKFRCFCCQFAVCGRCLCDTEFVVVKGKKGLCNTCLELALLIEDKKGTNSNGVPVDFNDTETYEYLFKYYWAFVKEEEGLTSEQLHSSYHLLKAGKNCDFQETNNYKEDASDFEDDGDQISASDYDDLDQVQYYGERKKRKLPVTRKNGKSKKMEFLGWASKQLTEFLMSAGKNVMQELSQHDVVTIVLEYCNEHKLFHPEKKKKVICDERLQSLLGRKSINRNGIHKLLTVHFAENWEQSEDSVQSNSKEEDDNIIVPHKSQRKSIPDRKFEEKEIDRNQAKGCLAAIVSKNIRLVYLKRSLIEELAKHSDTFCGKMIGSFVRVRSDPNDYLQKNSYVLVQVKGIKIKEEMCSIILLQVSNMLNDVPLSKLSDDDFNEEECEDLSQRMRTSRLKRLTVVELEQKARILHEDITKHWIRKELVLLQNMIDRANEKGWRRELSEYMEKMLLLQTPSYQSRLIHEIPQVVADVSGPEHASDFYPREDKEEHKVSSESSLFPRNQKSVENNGKMLLLQTNQTPSHQSCLINEIPRVVADVSGPEHASDYCPIEDKEEQNVSLESSLFSRNQKSVESNGDAFCRADRMDAAEGKQPPVEPFVSDDHRDHSKFIATGVESDEAERNKLSQEVKKSCQETTVPHLSLPESSDGQSNAHDQEKQRGHTTGEKLSQPMDIGGHVKVEKQVDVIDISDDDEVAVASFGMSRQTIKLEDRDWYYIGPSGNVRGPYSITLLKEWSDTKCSELPFKVLKSGQRPEEAVLLTDAIRQILKS